MGVSSSKNKQIYIYIFLTSKKLAGPYGSPTFKEPKLILPVSELTLYKIWSWVCLWSIFPLENTYGVRVKCSVGTCSFWWSIGRIWNLSVCFQFPALLPPHPSDASLGGGLPFQGHTMPAACWSKLPGEAGHVGRWLSHLGSSLNCYLCYSLVASRCATETLAQ